MDPAALNLSSGIVPGFPHALPAHLEQAWLTIVQKPNAATITTLPDGGVRISLKHQAKTFWALTAAVTSIGVIMMVGGWLFDRYQRSPDFDSPVRFGMIKIYLLGGMSILLGLILALIQAVGGTNQDAVIETSRGRLKVDRYIAGDHVVREYSPSEIGMIWVDSAIGIDARLGPFSVAIFTPTDVQIAAAEILGTIFWGDEAVVARNVKSAQAADGVMKIAIAAAPAC